MNILVYDVAASSGGAVTVLDDYLGKFKNDKENFYFIVLSTHLIEDTENIKSFNYRWIKKSWFHRFFFDCFVAPKLIKKLDIKSVISLQNTFFHKIKVQKTVLVHNALFFSDFKFSLLRHPKIWIYQNFIGKLVFKAIRDADKVIVQSSWMKSACATKTGVSEAKIIVAKPEIALGFGKFESAFDGRKFTFFYPAGAAPFKNHKIIMDAARLLKEEGINNYRVELTLTGNENYEIKHIRKTVIKEKLPLSFVGWMTGDQVQEKYKHSFLIFPSFIETVGLPLYEAQLYETPILSTRCNYAINSFEGYKNVEFFDYDSSKQLSQLMINHITKKM